MERFTYLTALLGHLVVRGPTSGVAVDAIPGGIVINVVYEALNGFAAGAVRDWGALVGGEVDWGC